MRYSIRGNVWDVFLMVACGFLGFGLIRFGFPIIPMVIGFILGIIAENSLMQSLQMSLGSVSILFTRPQSIVAIVILVAFALVPVWASIRSHRKGRASAAVDAPESNRDLPSPERRLSKGTLVFELGLLVVFSAFLYGAILLGSRRGTLPFIVSAVALATVLLIMVGEFVPGVRRYFETGLEYFLGGGGGKKLSEREKEEPVQLAVGMVALVIGMTLAVYWLGFLAAAPLAFLAYLLGGRKMRWSTALIFTAVVWVVLYFGFDQLLQMNLWRGAMPELIPHWIGGEIVPGFFW